MLELHSQYSTTLKVVTSRIKKFKKNGTTYVIEILTYSNGTVLHCCHYSEKHDVDTLIQSSDHAICIVREKPSLTSRIVEIHPKNSRCSCLIPMCQHVETAQHAHAIIRAFLEKEKNTESKKRSVKQ